MTATATRLITTCAAAVLTLGLAACAGSTPAPPVTTPSAAAAAPGPTGTASGAPASARVSANTASEEEIAAALTGAGVSNPDRWAEEVVEYRPYPPDDPNLTVLRDNLAKYNPGEETTDRIVAALTP
jgi:DNA uptake protein ComE-like DNA-binding protein